MQVNWIVVLLVGVALVGCVIWMIIQNQKDKKHLMNKLNQDYPKPSSSEDDIDIKEESSL